MTRTRTFRSRTWTGKADLPAMIDLLCRARPREWLADYPSTLDLEEMAQLDAFQQNVRLWWVAGKLAGFACLDPVYQNLAFEVDLTFSKVLDPGRLIRWAIRRWKRILPPDTEEISLDCACRAEDQARIAWITRFKFRPQPVWSLRLERDLTQPIPEAGLPVGFDIRPVQPEDDEAWVKVAQAAHGTQDTTTELRVAMCSGMNYERGLDLVVTAPGGELVGYCVCTINKGENILTGRKVGFCDPIAVHPDYQRRGLAQALLVEGMCRLRERGMEVAALGTSSENDAAIRVYEAAGFRVVSRRGWYRRKF